MCIFIVFAAEVSAGAYAGIRKDAVGFNVTHRLMSLMYSPMGDKNAYMSLVAMCFQSSLFRIWYVMYIG